MQIKVVARATRAAAAKVAKAVNQSPIRAIPAAVNPSRVRAILATRAVAATSSVFNAEKSPIFGPFFFKFHFSASVTLGWNYESWNDPQRPKTMAPGSVVKRITRQITADPTLNTNRGVPISDNQERN
jgi:hypothetical protein